MSRTLQGVALGVLGMCAGVHDDFDGAFAAHSKKAEKEKINVLTDPFADMFAPPE